MVVAILLIAAENFCRYKVTKVSKSKITFPALPRAVLPETRAQPIAIERQRTVQSDSVNNLINNRQEIE